MEKKNIKEKKMKISFFIGSLQRGGAERVISILANYYCSKDWDVDIILLLNTNVGYDLKDKIVIKNFIESGNSYGKRFPAWFIKIRRYLKKERPDRIVSFIGRINVLVLISSLGLKIPVIVSERNDPKHDGRGKFMLWLCNKCYKYADAIVYQTKYERSCFSSKLYKKSLVVANPVTINSTLEAPKNMVLVTVGRLSPQKNQMMIIDAFNTLKEIYPKLLLDIYGEGSLKEDLIKRIKELELDKRVALRGNVSDLHIQIASAKIFILTSEFEGLSNALIEAMMLGLPCISTDYPGSDEIITNEENGLIVPRGDVIALSSSIRAILDDLQLETKIRKNALSTAEKYKKEKVLIKWENIIR